MSDALRTTDDAAVAHPRIAELEVTLAAERAMLAVERATLATERAAHQALETEHDRLLGAYQALQLQVELMRRRLFVAKAERIDTAQLELEFAAKLAALDALAGRLAPAEDTGAGDDDKAGRVGGKRKPTGRRDLRVLDLPEERIEIPDPTCEGTAPRIGSEDSLRMMWRRGTFVCVVTARIKYRVAPAAAAAGVDADTAPTSDLATIVTAPRPPELIERSLGTPSVWALIASDKFCDGLPVNRQQDRFARAGFPLDRGTQCRWLEQLGGSVGATVVEAMRIEALATAFCIATDATGILIQPLREPDQPRRACRRGHFFVQIADADHVFFEYQAKETSAAVGEMFRGFSGYVQADAKSVYDLLYRSPDERRRLADDSDDGAVRHEVGCWSHARTKFWEVAVTSKEPVAREALARIMRIFALDRTWKKSPPAEIKALREQHLRPHVDSFFAFVDAEYERVKDQRGLLRSALGYAHRQHGALTRFFDDGRLKLTNNNSERELRRIATGRKAWLFCGSDDHAQAAGNLLTLIASARLHGLDPQAYLRDLFRVLPQWPGGRYLELAPKYWLATRTRLDAAQLAVEVGWLTIPPPEQPTAS